MKLFKTNQLKSLLLAGVLSLSLFLGGCSSTSTLSTISNSNTAQENNDNFTSTSDVSLPKNAVEASVERVVDGDTMKVKFKDSGESVTLRLLLIDTPESVKPGVDPQPYSLDASNFAKEVLQVGDSVYIEYDDGDKTDKYDRHLCYLWYYSQEDKDWKMYNEKIVEKGLARVGYIYSQKRHLDNLYAAQDKAKTQKLNIWSVDGYVTEKGFDVDAYNNSSSENTSSETVYANSNSQKYHSSEHAHGMKESIKMTESEAKSKGYSPCGICY